MEQHRPRSYLAPNASPMTDDGTITYVVGHDRVVVMDPGSADPGHLDALSAVVSAASRAVVIVTHDHPDHSAGALELAERTGAALLGGHAGRHGGAGADPERPRGARTVETGSGVASRAAGGGLLADGTSIETDDGELVVVRTPGHSPDHIALHWPSARAIFCGDLMMGGHDTSVVAAPEGDLRDYMHSLERIRALAPRIIYPAHGPPFTDPADAFDRYIRHRRERLDQVRDALDALDPLDALDALDADDGGVSAVTDRVYGPALDPALRLFAEAAVQAYIAYLRRDSDA